MEPEQSILEKDHWQKRTIDFLIPRLQETKALVRISTGFFSIQGYNLIRRYLTNKVVHIMVGYDETSKDRLREKLVADIMAHLRQWDIENRREAVLDLVSKLQRGELRIVERGEADYVSARIRKEDHGKVYIFDDSCAVVGSSNLTMSGLLHNVEAATAVVKPDQVAFWVDLFTQYWNHPDTYDLTDELLTALLQWLDLHPPYDVYLRAIEALVPENDVEPPRESYKKPVKYQLVVVERMLRQLANHRGAMVVASTGLGKTIMAAHAAYRLQQAGHIRNVLVFAPRATYSAWEEALDSAGLNFKVFTRDLLDWPSRKQTKKVNQILEALDRVDNQYLIVVDESHYFRNFERPRDGDARHAFRRLIETTSERKPYVILLTATPYAKDVDDLNNQLLLLPHTGPRRTTNKHGQMALGGFEDLVVSSPNAWQVSDSEDFFPEFMNMPVCTVISTSQVARDFAIHTEQGDYIDFHSERRWLPRIEVRKISVPVPLERQMSQALDEGFFKHELTTFPSRGRWQRSYSTIENQARIAWTSSPLALKETVEKTLNRDSDVRFIRSDEDTEQMLRPILHSLEDFTYQDDIKFQTLCRYLRDFHASGQKVIIFTERRATAIYLERGLMQEMPEIRVASVIREVEPGKYELKDHETEVVELLRGFAPQANPRKAPRTRTPGYDVFISTDAYGTGVNLQDASVAISYDIAWTADIIIQRAGRILRLWERPRQVYLYVFVNRFEVDIQRKKESLLIEERLDRLVGRSRQAEKFTNITMLPDTDSAQYESLADLPGVTVEHLGLADYTEIEEFTGVSRFLKHITVLQHDLERVRSLPDDISSALGYPEKVHRVYVLLKYQGTYHWTMYDVKRNRLEAFEEGELLDLIQCVPETPIANVSPDDIERYAQKCKALWCRREQVNPELVERVSAMYLKPYAEEDDFDAVLKRR